MKDTVRLFLHCTVLIHQKATWEGHADCRRRSDKHLQWQFWLLMVKAASDGALVVLSFYFEYFMIAEKK